MGDNQYRSNVQQDNMDNLFKGLGAIQQAGQSNQNNALKQLLQQREIQSQQAMPGIEEASKEKAMEKQAELQGQEQDRNLSTLKDLLGNVKPGEKMNFKVGDVSGGMVEDNPLKYMLLNDKRKDALAEKMGEEARKAQTHVDGFLKDGKASLDAAKSTLDNLDLGTQEGDTAAIINEGKALGGARAAVAFAAKLDPGRTMPGLVKNIANAFDGQAVSALTPDIRDNLREMAFQRGNTLQKTYQTAKAGLSAQIAAGSPISQQYGNVKNIQDSAFQTYDSAFDELNQRHKAYMDQKAAAVNQGNQTAQNPQQPYSPHQSVMGQVGGALMNGLKALNPFSGSSQQTAPQAQSPQDPGMARYQELLKKQQQSNPGG